MEYAHHLRMKYPNLYITDDLMPVPKHKQYLASLVGYAQMAGFAVAFFGTQIFGALSVPVPHWAQYLQENKGATIGIFFVGNIINSNLISTGAFEVYLGGRLLHSKIKTGVLPDFDELVRVVGAELDGRARVIGK
mmetsp:Transcript_5889/g.13017  ORF Transcript_5889/g.13017 Transcript_5889/m.13017 type:complete len:135 (-) Transcript_5889:115-519(-)